LNQQWQQGQRAFESQMAQEAQADNIQVYFDEIESVREIYTEVFHLSGKVLDVGGHQGRLRHYLTDDVTQYVSIDPIPFNLHQLEEQPNLLKAYPCLLGGQSYPSTFYTGVAEDLHLFSHNTFDWVHMRSVIDHFENPEQALTEAYRVCKHGGHILVGFAVMERKPKTLRAIWDSIFNPDEHTTHLTVKQLHDLYRKIGGVPRKEHWQKAPYQYCLYSCAEKL
jgi:ubiquinone/menaquinone biosynthesis C-methylase UbiE